MKPTTQLSWLAGSIIFATCAFPAWSQVEIGEIEIVSQEEADAAAMELANGLDFGIEDDTSTPSPTPQVEG